MTRVEIGPFVLTEDRGMARLEFTPDPTHVWTWPTNTSPDPWKSFGEELAAALSLIDRRFEVRRYK